MHNFFARARVCVCVCVCVYVRGAGYDILLDTCVLAYVHQNFCDVLGYY